MTMKAVRRVGKRVKRCGQCVMVRINGVVCHERGCVNQGKPESRWIK